MQCCRLDLYTAGVKEDTEFSRIPFSAWYRYGRIEHCVDRVRIQSKGQMIIALSTAFVPKE